MSPQERVREDSSRISPGWLWFGVVAAPIAWAVQGLFGWYFGGADCVNGSMAGGGSLQVAETLISIGAAIVAIVGIVHGWRDWGRSGEPTRLEAANGRTRTQYVAAAGALVSSIFLIAIIWAGIGGVIVNACGSAR